MSTVGHDMHGRTRCALALLLAPTLVAVTLVACGTPPDSEFATATVTADGVSLEFDGVTVTGPAGVAPLGTELRIERESRDIGDLGTYAVSLDEGVSITLNSGEESLQPEFPLTVTFAVDRAPADTEWAAPQSVVLLSQSAAEEWVDAVPAEWNAASESVSAELGHLSWFAPVQFDLGAVWKNVRDAAMQGLGIETPRPDCADRPAEIDGGTISVISPWNAWICLRALDGNLTVDVTSNSGIPFVLQSDPSSAILSNPEFGTTGILSQAIFNALFADAGALLAPGGTATLQFRSADPRSIYMEQYPAMLILAILVRVIEVAIPPSVSSALLLDKFEAASCLNDVVATATVGAVNAESAGRMAQALFSCAGVALADAAVPVRIVLAILAAAPALFAGAVIGLINEFTGQDSVEVTFDVVRDLGTAIPAELRGTWCVRSGADAMGGAFGWEADPCFSFSKLFAEFPDGGIESFEPSPDRPGVSNVHVCLEFDLGDSCSTASSMYFYYYPVGVSWDCQAYVNSDGRWPSCDPDYTTAHDSSQSRLLYAPNHQQAPMYMDSEPMYRP
jgi:hypothetical protein